MTSREDVDDEESKAAVDRVLAKFDKLKVQPEDKEGDFDARYELGIKEKMDEWKRNYYKVSLLRSSIQIDLLTLNRASSSSLTTTPKKCTT